ncbi:MAG: FAD-dependent monooxygenase, partial [Verrucomicrobiota bacterium]
MKAIIIGAGIGGLTTAIALQQKGIEFEIYEAAPELKEIGAGIWVPTNAMNVFERLGLAGRIKSEGKLMEEISVGNTEGTLFQKISAADIIPRFGNGTTTIHRGRLQSLLRAELDPTRIHTGKRLVRFEENASQVTAWFADESSASGDLLLGADGLRSVVRKEMFGLLPLRYSGQTCWRAATRFRLPESLSTRMCERWGKGLRFAYSQMSDEQVYFYATVAAPEGGRDLPGRLKESLKERYAAFGKLACEVIDSADESQIIRTDLYDLKPISHWVKG